MYTLTVNELFHHWFEMWGCWHVTDLKPSISCQDYFLLVALLLGYCLGYTLCFLMYVLCLDLHC